MSDLPYSILYTLVALTLVLTLAWLVIRYLSSLSQFRSSGNELHLRSTLVLGPGQRVVVVTFRESDYLLGVTGERISLVDKVPTRKTAIAGPNADPQK